MIIIMSYRGSTGAIQEISLQLCTSNSLSLNSSFSLANSLSSSAPSFSQRCSSSAPSLILINGASASDVVIKRFPFISELRYPTTPTILNVAALVPPDVVLNKHVTLSPSDKLCCLRNIGVAITSLAPFSTKRPSYRIVSSLI